MTSVLSLLALAWPHPAFVQEPEPPAVPPAEEQEPEGPGLEDLRLPGEQDPTISEVIQAIETISETFVRVDRLWTEARSAADAVFTATGESAAFAEKLDAGVSEAELLITEMEHLLEILPESDSDQQQQQQQNQQQQQQQNEGQQEPGEQREGDGRENRDGERDGKDPDDSLQGNQRSMSQAPGDVPPESAVPIFLAPGSAGGSWGHLPPRLQQTLQNSHAEDLPLRYRSLLEQFHKRRNQDR